MLYANGKSLNLTIEIAGFFHEKVRSILFLFRKLQIRLQKLESVAAFGIHFYSDLLHRTMLVLE